MGDVDSSSSSPNFKSFIPRSLAPFERYPNELTQLRVRLGQLLDHHVSLTGRVIGAGGQFFVVDMWVMGVAQRSFHLVEGFLQVFDGWHVTVAAPLVRFQIENVYRTMYILEAPNGPEVVLDILKGTELRKMKAFDNGALLTDAELVARAARLFPWLPDVYTASNDWVHLSERHVFNANRLGGDDAHPKLNGRVPLAAEDIPVTFLQELLAAMRQATRDLFALLEVWEEWKLSHPGAESVGLDVARASTDNGTERGASNRVLKIG